MPEKIRRYAYTITAVLCFSLLFLALPSYYRDSELFQRLTAESRDVFFKIRLMSSAAPEKIKDIVIVAIDEESCEKLQARWPWSRKVFAEIIDVLKRHGAKAIGLNISFTGLEDGSITSTQILADALHAHGNTVVGSTFDKENRLIRPTPIIAANANRYGYLEKILDSDLVIRRSYLVRPYQTKSAGFESSFPLQMAAATSGESSASNAAYDSDLGLVTVGTPHIGIRVLSDASHYINYLAGPNDFHQIPAWKILNDRVPDSEIRGKVVLVGLTSSLFFDQHPTPLGVMPGVCIHANELISILTGRALKFTPDEITFLISWIIGLCVLVLFLFHRIWLALAGFVLSIFGILLGVEILFASDLVFEPLILCLGPILGMILGFLTGSIRLLFEKKGLEAKVIHDKMTNLYNYDYLRMRLDDEWRRSQKLRMPLSLAMTDLDRFKKINDTLGHEVGNQMILRAAKVIRDSVRGYDVVARYGGDEFVVLLWHTNSEDAQAWRNRLRDSYHDMAHHLDDPLLKDSSISIGVASFNPEIDPKTPKNPQQLIELADQDLFRDKESRRRPNEERR